MKKGLENDLAKVLIDRRKLAARVKEMAGEISDAMDGTELTVVPILSGSIIFTADLIRELPHKLRINVIGVSSYSGATTVGEDPRILHALTADLTNRNVLVIDDIFDTGRTIGRVVDHILTFAPHQVKVAVLLRKDVPHAVKLRPDFVGFQIPDEFVVGYGLDFNGFYRNLPDVGVLRPELYGK